MDLERGAVGEAQGTHTTGNDARTSVCGNVSPQLTHTAEFRTTHLTLVHWIGRLVYLYGCQVGNNVTVSVRVSQVEYGGIYDLWEIKYISC